MSAYANPHILIDTDDLERQLGSADLRILDCNLPIAVQPDGSYQFGSGMDEWAQGHIPGSRYVDIMNELSAPHPTLKFMMPEADQFAGVMSRLGVGSDHWIVLYGRGENYWATRLYFMFRAVGFDQVQVLNGGWDKWVLEDRPVTTDATDWPTASFNAEPPSRWFVDKGKVLAAIGNADTLLINALSPEVHSGEKPAPAYKRPGHIADSINVFFRTLVDPESKAFLPADELRARLEASGALDAKQVITYCGGGVSATVDAFALLLLGHDDVTIYDGSLTEWGPDETLPMEVG